MPGRIGFLSILMLCFSSPGSLAQLHSGHLSLPAVISDHMVLQQRTKAVIWGWAEKGGQVNIAPGWTTKKYTVVADSTGKWEAAIATPSAGGPYNIEFTGSETHLTVKDVFIGEVWVCSGQSNMEMPLKGYRKQPVLNAAAIIAAAAHHPEIHVFRVPKVVSPAPLSDCGGSWEAADTGTAPGFSAVAYQYATALQEQLKVPVGIIATYWGGTAIQSWMSEETLSHFPEVWLTSRPDTIKDPEKDPEHAPSILFNSMILPVCDYTVKGFVWYQGESNREHPLLYRRLLPAMVKEWRARWGGGTLPFYYVQIAPYGYADPYHKLLPAVLRESQLLALQDIPNAGMAVILDAGEEKYIHPPDKTVVSQRLAYLALAKTYHQKGVDCNSPVFRKMKIKGPAAYLYFDFVKHGLTSGNKALSQFEVAGADHIFHPATAIIVHRNQVKVQCDTVAAPVAVRYGFKNWVKGDLYNSAGLPASSFRTDDW
ncbi:sialate O-acetylesterase [Chitinophaga polysaccharea]|uniref:sialate O-acetylesterase n=1 Tax=Chitinophaga polysaccharea TaxID=1293035 RepID=UPI001C8D7ADE|nr:sialate O-acetylesterase [Chitinophaga polysaccharea]